MKRLILTCLAAAIFTAVTTTGAGTAHAAPTSQDSAFLADNEQTNLAEQSIGILAEQRGKNTATKALAQKTVSDHQAAQAKVTAVAQALAITLPMTPNATQLEQATQLKTESASAFDLDYAQIQIVGHQLSIADTQKDISSGSSSSVIAYAQSYLPIAQMHLQMAQAEVAALGGNPTGVPAGSGGMAATGSPDRLGWELGLISGAAAVIVGGALIINSRRRGVSSL